MGCHDMRMLQHVNVSRCRDVEMSACMRVNGGKGWPASQSSIPTPRSKDLLHIISFLSKEPPPPSSPISANTNTNTASSQISVRGGTVICLFFTRPHQLEKARSVQILETAKHRSRGLGGTVPSQLFLACPQHFQPGTNNGINEGRHTSYLWLFDTGTIFSRKCYTKKTRNSQHWFRIIFRSGFVWCGCWSLQK